ncbi:MAG: tripartite tricarboxylate transporter permease [Chloroflexota bacterium]
MLQFAIEALTIIFQPATLGLMFFGIGIGVMVGILPGLGGTVGMSLLLPFIFGMDAQSAIPLMIGMAAVIHTADTFPSVLLGVPGSSGSQATIMDGYPLARLGQAARALGAAFFSSMFGGLIGATTLLLILPIARPMVLAFGSPELFMLAVLGLSMVAILAGKRPLRGLISGMLGLLIGSIGAAPTTPFYRYTFDALYLYDGIKLAVLALGLFALPEILDLLASGTSIAQKDSEDKAVSSASGWLQGLRDVIANRFLVLRSAVIGVIVGFIPGLGGSVVDWISYGLARQTVPNPDNFGKGDVRGVIAPESSNNAKEGGSLIPTLLFGIPGSGTTAVLLGAFVILGLQPGPRMLKETGDLNVTILIIMTLAVANVFGALACLLMSGVVSKLATIRAARLAPFLLVIMLAGAYQSTRSWGDLLAFLLIGLLGWVMRHLKYPLPPLLIGFVLSVGVERYLWLSTTRYEWEWLTRPGVLIIAAITIVLTIGSFRVNQQTAATAAKLKEEAQSGSSSS